MKHHPLVTFLSSALILASVAALAGPKGENPPSVLPVVISNLISGTISLPGQQDRFTFSGSVGQRLYFDSLDADGEGISIQITPPNGSSFWGVNHSTDTGPTYLTEAGVYTLTVSGSGDVTGDYAFRILDTANAASINYGATVTGQLGSQLQTVFYRFTGTNGQRVNVESLSASSGNAYFSLLAPNETSLLSGYISGSLGEAVLPMDGTYLVVVSGYVDDEAPLDFQMRVALVSNPSGSTSGTFGTVRSGNILLNQTNNTFSYTAPAGSLIYLDSLTNAGTAYVELLDPNGEQVFYVDGNADHGPYRLLKSGSHQMKIIGYGDGVYRFRLLHLDANATTLTNATTYAQTISVPFRTDVYRFTAATGQKLFYDALGYFDSSPIFARLRQPEVPTWRSTIMRIMTAALSRWCSRELIICSSMANQSTTRTNTVSA